MNAETPTTAITVTHEMIIAELKRELAQRERIYPGMITSGKIKDVYEAEKRLACLSRAIELFTLYLSNKNAAEANGSDKQWFPESFFQPKVVTVTKL